MSLTFSLPLRTSIVPAYAVGSATPTFTRASTATVVDHEGVLRYCRSGEARFWGARRVENLLRDSEDLTTGNWNGYGGGTFTVDTGIADPLGGSTAFRVTTGTSNGFLQDTSGRYGSLSYRAGEVVTASTWLRVASGTKTVNVYSQGSDGSNTTITVDTTWRRWCNDGASTAVGGKQPYIILQYTGALEIWRPSLNVVTGSANTAPPEYVSAGALSAPYHGAGADGVKYFSTTNGNSVLSNVVTEAAGVPISDSVLFGYLAEGQYTNRLLYSEDFSNAAWVKTNVTVSADSAAAPDGATTADTLTASAANGTVIQDLGVVASAQKNGALWLKRKTGSGNIQLTLDGGSTWTTVSVTASWTRFPIKQTLVNEDFGIRIVTSGDAVYAWGGDVVTADYDGSQPMGTYIPTTSAAVTRNVDALTFDNDGKVPQNTFTVSCRKSSVWSVYSSLPSDAPLGVGTYSGNAYSGIGGYSNSYGVLGSWPTMWSVLQSGPVVVPGPPPKQVYTFPSDMVAIKGYIDGVMFANTASEAKVSNWLSNKIGIQSNSDGSGAGSISWVRDIRIWDKVMPVGAGGDVLDASRFRRPFMKYQGLIAVTPSDGTNQHYEGFTVSVDGNVKVTDALGATNTLLCLAGVFYPLEVTRIWSTGTTATGILGLV